MEKLNSTNLLLYMAPIAVVFLFLATLFMEENVVGITLALTRDDFKIIWYLLFNSSLAYFVNFTNFLVTKHTSALTFQHCTIPLDTAKVRLQLQKKANTEDGVHLPKYRGTLNTVVTIAMDESMLALWKGIVPGLHRQCLYGGLRIRLYEPVKLFLVGSDFIGDVSLFKMILAALITGALAITVANPTDLVKVGLQAEGKLPAGIPRRYSGALNAYITIVRQLTVSSMRKSYYGCRKWSYSEILQLDESEMWNNFIVCFSKKRSILKQK